MCGRLGILLLAWLAGCTASPAGGARLALPSPMPVELAAALTAGAIATVLPFADPTPQFAGAPVRRAGDGWRVELYTDARGNWHLGGDHRLGVAPPRSSDLPAWPRTTATPWPHGGFAGRPAVVLTIRRNGNGSEVVGSLPRELALRIDSAVQASFALASDPTSANGGIDDANLARTCAHRLLWNSARTARNDGPDLALLRTAQRLGADDPALHRQIADLERQRGRLHAARTADWQALMASHDLQQRATAAAALAAAPGDGPSLRRHAATALAAGQLDAGAAMLHAARRLDDSPARHRPLRRELDQQRGDAFVALANRLLDREQPHGAQAPQLARWLTAVGLPRLAARAGVEPTDAEPTGAQPASAAFAAPPAAR